MKKIIISTISVSLFLSAFFAVKSVASIDEVDLFNANVEALADGEEAVTGHCEEKDKDCLAFCPKCGAAYWAPGHLGGSYQMSGNCVLCNQSM
jgi:hypothetical protein